MNTNEDEDLLETKPSILSILHSLNSLYEQPTMDESDQNGRYSSTLPSPVVGLANMSSDARTSLEDRFLELVQHHPCFYDPSDKNFAHNQYKSNVYGTIAKRLTSEGFHITGTQLATMYKGIKAKYRDEARKLSRMGVDEQIEPSPFFKKLSFLETGINSVDQRLATLRTSNGHQRQPQVVDNERKGYVSAFSNALDKFSPEMKGGFLNFITALNELPEPVKKLETFTRAARELKSKPGNTIEVVRSSTINKSNGVSSHFSMPGSNPDLQSIGRTFAGQEDLLAMFRVLGNTVMTLPERRRHDHIRGLLNISSASLNSPVQISWQSEVYKPVEKILTIADHTITIDGPSAAEIEENKRREKEDSVRVITPEPKKASKRKRGNDRDVEESDNDESISVITDESSHGRFPRAAKERSFVGQMFPSARIRRH